MYSTTRFGSNSNSEPGPVVRFAPLLPIRRTDAMRARLAISSTALVGCSALAWTYFGQNVKAQPAAACDTATTPFCDSRVALPANWNGHVFKLSQTYPTTAPSSQKPWTAFDPKTQPDQYIGAVLQYFYQGNIRPNVESSFDP